MAEQSTIQRPKRWDTPFGPDMTAADVDRVLSVAPLDTVDESQFPASQSLRDILLNDARIVRFHKGDIVIRQSDYGNSVFLLLQGTVRVVLDPEGEEKVAGHPPVRRRSWLSALGQLWRNPRLAEVRDIATYQGQEALRLRTVGDGEARTFVEDTAAFVAAHRTVPLGEGQMFGEIAALSRTPRTVTVFADSECEMLELRWQGLRDIRRRDAGFRSMIDRLYRERSLGQHLTESPLFRNLDDDTLALIAASTTFETYGDFEWFGQFKQARSRDATGLVEQEPVIAEQGHYVDGLIMIRAGIGRVSETYGRGWRTTGYLTQNEFFGLDEIVAHWRDGAEPVVRSRLTAVGYVDVLRVPTSLLEWYVLPNLPPHRLPSPAPKAKASQALWERPDRDDLPQSLVNFLVDQRIVNGTAAMMINTDRCVGCDDCVRACAVNHDNNPRFVRHGVEHRNLMVTNACMHCRDPVCLIGCPTGAIHRERMFGQVVIDDKTCIGCATCANSCPYNNIRMVEIRESSGAFIQDQDTGAPIVKATKCDLCIGQLGGPACERACPHDALIRIDLRERDRLARWTSPK